MSRLLLAAISLLLFAGQSIAGQSIAADATPSGIEFFEKRIRPELVKHCYKCHSADAKNVKGGLLLDTRAGILNGGESGPAVVPKKPDESLLVDALRHESFKMPPSGKLPDAIIADFEKWIAMGAPDPRLGKASSAASKITFNTARSHWSFQPLSETTPPAVQQTDWPRDAIDRFILARLETNGLKPVADAGRRVLLRRAYFDLTGLPPTPEEVAAFVKDASSDAFAKQLDQLLASPHFGERWGRYWLDLARYAESNGRDRNVIFPHAWRYRDYVIQSFNDDKPYDKFVQEQIAGDLLPAADSEQRDEQFVATGFLTLGPKVLGIDNKELFRMDLIDEQIDVTSRVFLGLTVSCARCHDHKFDPIPTSEYYGLAGIFGSTQTMYGPATKGNQFGFDMPLQPIGKDADKLHAPAQAFLKAVAEQTTVRNKARSDRYRVVRNKAALENKKKKTKDAQKIAEIDKQIEPLAAEIAEWDEKIKQLDEELKTLESMPPQFPDYCMAVCEAEKPADEKVRIRGEHNKYGPVSPRGFLTIASGGSSPRISDANSGRLQLAQWLTSPGNPLTARVAVNRLWQHLFGRGLVRSVNNFGAMGDRPTHPQLLDNLAIRFQTDGWSIKRMIRRIMLSRTYQLGSDHDPASYAADADNRLLWRMNFRRLDVEALRDAILAVSGRLDAKPPVGSVVSSFTEPEFNQTVKLSPAQLESNHRSVYLPLARNWLPEMFNAFDFADPNIVIGQRDERTMPSQALYLMNSSFVIEQSGHAARRLLSADGLDDAGRIGLAYRLFLSRPATDRERERVMGYLKEVLSQNHESQNDKANGVQDVKLAAWASVCQTLFGSAEFRYLE